MVMFCGEILNTQLLYERFCLDETPMTDAKLIFSPSVYLFLTFHLYSIRTVGVPNHL